MSNLIKKDILNEGPAADKAKQQGLQYAGWGKWADKSGVVVAKTVDDKLVKIGGQKKSTKLLPKKKLVSKHAKKAVTPKSSKNGGNSIDPAVLKNVFNDVKKLIAKKQLYIFDVETKSAAVKIAKFLEKKGSISKDQFTNIIFPDLKFSDLSPDYKTKLNSIYDVIPNSLKADNVKPISNKSPFEKALGNFSHSTGVEKLLAKYNKLSGIGIDDIARDVFGYYFNDLSSIKKAKAKKLYKLYGDWKGINKKSSIKKSADVKEKSKKNKPIVAGEVVEFTLDAYKSAVNEKEIKVNQVMQKEMKKDAQKQAITWRSSFEPKTFQQITKYTSEWQDDSQFHRPASYRKKRNEFLNKIMSGNPPAIIKTNKPIYRGMELHKESAKKFLASIKLGKTLKLPPSGFSANHKIARGFSTDDGSSDTVGVLIKLYPSKKNEINGMHLAYQGKATPKISGPPKPYGKKMTRPPKRTDFPDNYYGKERFDGSLYDFKQDKFWYFPTKNDFADFNDGSIVDEAYNHEQEIIINGNAVTKVRKIMRYIERDEFGDDRNYFVIELENMGLAKVKPVAKIKDNYNPLLREDEFEKLMNTSQGHEETEFEKKMNTSVHFTSPAAEKASELGYKYKGFGYWEKDGIIVARTIKGQLVPMTKKNAQQED